MVPLWKYALSHGFHGFSDFYVSLVLAGWVKKSQPKKTVAFGVCWVTPRLRSSGPRNPKAPQFHRLRWTARHGGKSESGQEAVKAVAQMVQFKGSLSVGNIL